MVVKKIGWWKFWFNKTVQSHLPNVASLPYHITSQIHFVYVPLVGKSPTRHRSHQASGPFPTFLGYVMCFSRLHFSFLTLFSYAINTLRYTHTNEHFINGWLVRWYWVAVYFICNIVHIQIHAYAKKKKRTYRNMHVYILNRKEIQLMCTYTNWNIWIVAWRD